MRRGRYVAFHSGASNLIAHDTNKATDVFVRDRKTGATMRVSVSGSGEQANSGSFWPAISASGRFVVFSSYASNLVAGDTNNESDVFVRDRLARTTVRVSVRNSGEQMNDHVSDQGAISADGRVVAFTSMNPNGGGGRRVRARPEGRHDDARVRRPGGKPTGDDSWSPVISADARFVAFSSYASNLAANDTNEAADVFVRNRFARTTTRVSMSSGGDQANGDGETGAISADGRLVVFVSDASNLVAHDTNKCPEAYIEDQGCMDVFLRDRAGA